MLNTRRLAWVLIVAAAVAGPLVGCTDDAGIYDRPTDGDLTGAKGFLGYSNVDTKSTFCGNCHVGQQARWKGSAHADAWETLQGSGHASAVCEGCHTVGPFGNSTTGDVGFFVAPEERYHDVQCESCHGPGQNHVLNPDIEGNQPLPSIAVAAGLACGECHSGAHHPFVEEWAQSKHAVLEPHIVEGLEAGSNYSSCLSCHSAQGVLTAWGVTSNYVERNAPQAEYLGIVCAVCHDPHGTANSAQLRFPIDVADPQVNLCMRCHNRRAEPEITSTTIRGPHAPEGPLLLGDAGWWPPGIDLGQTTHPHGSATNSRLCASCHVNNYAITDASTGAFVIQATGHIFDAIPCLDENGVPIPGGDCDDSERTFQACAASGCHLTAEDGRAFYRAWRFRVDELVGDIETLLDEVPPGEFDTGDGIFTVADGAWFNAELGKLPGTPIHNPRLSVKLLEASISALETTYGLSAPRRQGLLD